MDATQKKTGLIERITGFKPPSKKKMFWAWITYQAIKGTLTTTFIWVPALIYWFQQ